MKQKHLFRFLLSAFFALIMLLFTFCTFAWYSDVKGFQWGFEIPIGTGSGTLLTVADSIWMAAPFCMLYSLPLFFMGKLLRKIGILLSCLPLSLYALLRILAFFDGEEAHGTLFVTLLSLLVLGCFTVAAAFLPEAERAAPLMAFSYVGLEIFLVILSAVFQEKYSFFYFSQLLPMGHNSHFRFSFFAISPFLYYLSYAISLGLRIIPLPEKAQQSDEEIPKEVPPQEKSCEETKNTEENEEITKEELATLSLEDLGISR